MMLRYPGDEVAPGLTADLPEPCPTCLYDACRCPMERCPDCGGIDCPYEHVSRDQFERDHGALTDYERNR